jgi:hypothetical protein
VDGSEEPLANGDSSGANSDQSGAIADHPAVDEGRPMVDDNAVRYSLAWWLSFAIPISIAMVAIMGAVVGYYAEDHASLASTADNNAQTSLTYASGHSYNALLTGQLAETEHRLWEQLAGARAGHSTGLAMITAVEPECANAGSSTDSMLAAELTADCRLAQVFSDLALPGYWEHGDPAVFDTERYVADWVALGNFGRDVAVDQHEAVAEAQRHQELRLLWLAMLLAVALAFCTLAQAASHHRWSKRTTVLSLLIAIPGWILLIGCSAVLLVWEL